VPDKIIDFSIGELGCAYADGCITAEQMILFAYSRGLESIETKVTNSSMSTVDLGYENIKDRYPSDIKMACHNAADSNIIIEPAKSMKEFVAQLQVRLTHIIFVKKIF